jgi:hypothetical protein
MIIQVPSPTPFTAKAVPAKSRSTESMAVIGQGLGSGMK